MLKEIQDFLNFLDARTARKKAEKAKALVDKKVDAAYAKIEAQKEQDQKHLLELQVRKKQLNITIATCQAQYKESYSYYIEKHADGHRTRGAQDIQNERTWKAQIAAAQKELEFVGAEIDELTKSEDT